MAAYPPLTERWHDEARHLDPSKLWPNPRQLTPSRLLRGVAEASGCDIDAHRAIVEMHKRGRWVRWHRSRKRRSLATYGGHLRVALLRAHVRDEPRRHTLWTYGSGEGQGITRAVEAALVALDIAEEEGGSWSSLPTGLEAILYPDPRPLQSLVSRVNQTTRAM